MALLGYWPRNRQRGDLYIAGRLVPGAVADVVEIVCSGVQILPVFISLFGVFVTGSGRGIQAGLVRYAIRTSFSLFSAENELADIWRCKTVVLGLCASPQAGRLCK